MILVDNVLLSDEIILPFACNIQKCQGNCCVEGENGPPSTPSEIRMVGKWLSESNNLELLKTLLHPDAYEKIKQGDYSYFIEDKGYLGIFENEGRCLFSYFDENICRCSIEPLKPISCSLFPLRIKKVNEIYLVNFEKRTECLGGVENPGIPVYKYVKKSLIQFFGEEWYSHLEKTLEELNKNN